VNLGDLQ